MDPNATLEEMKRIAGQIANDGLSTSVIIEKAYRLAELTLMLDEWIARGGALPFDWTNP